MSQVTSEIFDFYGPIIIDLVEIHNFTKDEIKFSLHFRTHQMGYIPLNKIYDQKWNNNPKYLNRRMRWNGCTLYVLRVSRGPHTIWYMNEIRLYHLGESLCDWYLYLCIEYLFIFAFKFSKFSTFDLFLLFVSPFNNWYCQYWLTDNNWTHVFIFILHSRSIMMAWEIERFSLRFYGKAFGYFSIVVKSMKRENAMAIAFPATYVKQIFWYQMPVQ